MFSLGLLKWLLILPCETSTIRFCLLNAMILCSIDLVSVLHFIFVSIICIIVGCTGDNYWLSFGSLLLILVYYVFTLLMQHLDGVSFQHH